MGQDPSAIRQSIEETRMRMGETIEALSYKTDVSARLNDALTDRRDALGAKKDRLLNRLLGIVPNPTYLKENAMQSTTNLQESAMNSASSATYQAKQAASAVQENVGQAVGNMQENAGQAVSLIQENPLGLAIGAAAIGFLAGVLIPNTNMEDEKFGPVADQVRGQMADTAQEAMDHGKQLAQETVQAASQTMQERAQAHAKELSRSVQNN